MNSRAMSEKEVFLPTPSVRRATHRITQLEAKCKISTHALREEGDCGRPSARCHPRWISTHALREEGDSTPTRTPSVSSNFYPRPP